MLKLFVLLSTENFPVSKACVHISILFPIPFSLRPNKKGWRWHVLKSGTRERWNAGTPERRNTKTGNAGILKPGTPEYLTPECRNTKTWNARILKPGTPEYLNSERRNTKTRNAGIVKPGTPEFLTPGHWNT